MATKGLVLVTGATGYIASHVVQQLLAEGYNVRGTVRSTTGPKVAHLLDMGEKLQLVAADLLSPDCK
jgi:dihydroflavonol-4-reductase